jgi:glycosyltransferase involved in cell wall biosynthesis
LFSITIPSKTQAYMHMGRPILMAVKGDAADLVTRAKAGISCDPENPHEIAESVRYLYELPRPKLEEMGKNGQTFYAKEMSLLVGVRRFEQIFKGVSEPV